MRGAQSSITGGLDRLAGVAQGIEQNEQDNYEHCKRQQTNAFKDMMAGFNTQEETRRGCKSSRCRTTHGGLFRCTSRSRAYCVTA